MNINEHPPNPLVPPGFLHVEASWTFPSEEVPPLPDAADMERRVKREEILHTGKLRLKIVKAIGLGFGNVLEPEGSIVSFFFWKERMREVWQEHVQ